MNDDFFAFLFVIGWYRFAGSGCVYTYVYASYALSLCILRWQNHYIRRQKNDIEISKMRARTHTHNTHMHAMKQSRTLNL